MKAGLQTGSVHSRSGAEAQVAAGRAGHRCTCARIQARPECARGPDVINGKLFNTQKPTLLLTFAQPHFTVNAKKILGSKEAGMFIPG